MATFRSPYISITGIMSREEAMDIQHVYRNHGLGVNASHQLILAQLASAKTLGGYPNTIPTRFPKATRLGNEYSGIRALHYASDEPKTLGLQIIAISALFQPEMIQLNVTWPDLTPEVRTLIRAPHLRNRTQLILQIGPHAIDMMDGDPEKIAAKLVEYDGFIDRVLIDDSAGRGVPMNIDFVLACIQAITRLKIDVGIGIAGGLCAESIDRIEPIVRAFPHISIDAENGLRTTDDDRLSISKAVDYLKAAHALFLRCA